MLSHERQRCRITEPAAAPVRVAAVGHKESVVPDSGGRGGDQSGSMVDLEHLRASTIQLKAECQRLRKERDLLRAECDRLRRELDGLRKDAELDP